MKIIRIVSHFLQTLSRLDSHVSLLISLSWKVLPQFHFHMGNIYLQLFPSPPIVTTVALCFIPFHNNSLNWSTNSWIPSLFYWWIGILSHKRLMIHLCTMYCSTNLQCTLYTVSTPYTSNCSLGAVTACSVVEVDPFFRWNLQLQPEVTQWQTARDNRNGWECLTKTP